jgi:hypothetical protein
MIETLPDGTILAYIDADFNPVPPDDAVFVEITKPDGTKIIARPVKSGEGDPSPAS